MGGVVTSAMVSLLAKLWACKAVQAARNAAVAAIEQAHGGQILLQQAVERVKLDKRVHKASARSRASNVL